MAALDTVAKMIADARALLQDTYTPYRYSEADLIRVLNSAVLEARRLRPDLFLPAYTLPEFSVAGDSTASIEAMYRPAFVYYMVGKAQLRDDEVDQDSRATVFLNKFVAQLTANPS